MNSFWHCLPEVVCTCCLYVNSWPPWSHPDVSLVDCSVSRVMWAHATLREHLSNPLCCGRNMRTFICLLIDISTLLMRVHVKVLWRWQERGKGSPPGGVTLVSSACQLLSWLGYGVVIWETMAGLQAPRHVIPTTVAFCENNQPFEYGFTSF